MPITENCNAILQRDRLIDFLKADPLVNDLWHDEIQGYAIEQPLDTAVDLPEVAIFMAQESNLWSTTHSDSEPRLFVLFIAFHEPEQYADARVMTDKLYNITAAIKDALQRVRRDLTSGVQYWHDLTFGGSPRPEMPIAPVTTIYSRERGKMQYSRTFFALHSRVKSQRRGS